MAEDLTEVMKRCLSRYRFFNSQETIIVAVSTGVDSMCLLTAAEKIFPASRLLVAHVNHHLRVQSRVEEHYLRDYCRQHAIRLEVDQWTDHPGHGIEAAARAERYRFFAQLMKKYDSPCLLLAHQRDELAENMMMQLLRGGRLEQLIGMQTSRPFANNSILVRPFLTVSKEQLITYANKHHIRWYEDSTNQEDDALRNRFRHHYLPALEKENPRFKDHLLAYRQQLLDQEELLNDLFGPIMKKTISGSSLQLPVYESYQRPSRYEILRRWLAQGKVFDINNDQLEQADHWLTNREKPSGSYALGPNDSLYKDYEKARLIKGQKLDPSAFTEGQNVVKSELILNQWQVSHQGRLFGVFTRPPREGKMAACLYLKAGQLPLHWSNGETGGEIRLKNGGHQTLARLMINRKIARDQRKSWPTLLDHQGRVLWVLGLKTAWLDRTATDDTFSRFYLYSKDKMEDRHE